MKKIAMILLVVFAFGLGLSVQAQEEQELFAWEVFVRRMEPVMALNFALYLQEEFPSDNFEVGPGASFWNDYRQLNDYKFVYIEDMDLSSKNLTGFNFSIIVFIKCDFSRSSFLRNDMVRSHFSSCNFENCKMDRLAAFGVTFDDFAGDPCSFKGASVHLVEGSTFHNQGYTLFYNVDLSGAVFSGQAIAVFKKCLGNEKTVINLKSALYEDCIGLSSDEDKKIIALQQALSESGQRNNNLQEQIIIMKEKIKELKQGNSSE